MSILLAFPVIFYFASSRAAALLCYLYSWTRLGACWLLSTISRTLVFLGLRAAWWRGVYPALSGCVGVRHRLGTIMPCFCFKLTPRLTVLIFVCYTYLFSIDLLFDLCFFWRTDFVLFINYSFWWSMRDIRKPLYVFSGEALTAAVIVCA